jgi:hypothetical protein
LLTLAGVLVVLLVVWWPGCRAYPRVSSAEGLKLIKLLHTACNTQDANRLATAREHVAQAEANGRVTPAEATALRSIIDQAERGAWTAAEQACWQFAQDQVGRP